MESVVIDRSPSYSRRFGSVDGGLLMLKSLNTTYNSSSFPGQKNPTFNANLGHGHAPLFRSSLVHQPPLLPLPILASPESKGSRSAFLQHPRNKKPRPSLAHPRSSSNKEPNKPFVGKTNDVVVDKTKEKKVEGVVVEVEEEEVEVVVLAPPPSSVPMPRFSIMRGRKAAGTAGIVKTRTVEAAEGVGCGGGGGGGGGGGVDVCATDGLRRLLRL